tara:strand:- start:32 stop:418 length:387 start_codon:yes stop_codon:yes gene_type:complete
MPAVSKKQQRFFGIVRAIQKGEMAPTSPETAKAAASMKKKDVKDFASTDHEGLPEKKKKKEVNETAYYKSDSKYQKKISDEDKRNKEKDKRMKFGKFYAKAKEAKERLRPGEVKKWDKEKGRYVSNKE